MKLTKKNILNIGFEKIYSKGIEHFNIKPFGIMPSKLKRLLDDKLQDNEYHEIASVYEKQYETSYNFTYYLYYTYVVVMNRKKYLCIVGIDEYSVCEINTIEDLTNHVCIESFLKNKIIDI